nr:fused MFS/spermidine synthase [Williamsia sterculiae]
MHRIDSGTCELVADRFSGGWMLLVNGVESSHIDPDHPDALEFEYMRWMANLIHDRFPSDGRMRAVHLGGAGCALARHLDATYPQARQVAVEIDAELARLVREWFDLPRAPRLRIRVGDAAQVTAELTAHGREVIVRDVFTGAVTPRPLITRDFTRRVHDVLVPGGLYLVNCGDHRDLRLARAEIATIGSVFGEVVVVADGAMLKGRRYGNVVIAGSDTPFGDLATVARLLRSDPMPAQILDDATARRFAGSATPISD